MVVQVLSHASTARLLCGSKCEAYCSGGWTSRFVPRNILKDSFTYCLIRAGRSPRSAQLSLGGGTESLPYTLRLVVQLVQVYTTGADVIFLGVDQALLANVAALGRSVEEIREFRDRPDDLEHLEGVLAVDDGARAAVFEGNVVSLCRDGLKISLICPLRERGFPTCHVLHKHTGI